MYEAFIATHYFDLMLHFTHRIVTDMADGIIIEDVQDELLKDCYQNLNPQHLRGCLIDTQNVDIGGTTLTAVIDQFEKNTDEKSFLQNLKRWISFERKAPYANLSQIEWE
ncbi:hypothetical protein GYMLUDRAFT_65076 [Collybiopsis luxurians FD-317 M1]|uniref:Uncharacterized protein n=1 Tax=Collybiopsis luxurians FD-317 M1 TaxID=944289 RepID=A0A0D0C899_9AGAR|nr:hypothetical protein GYMLUDRAFT_65076 [Collybiopsis luxurians FD-317 M1]